MCGGEAGVAEVGVDVASIDGLLVLYPLLGRRASCRSSRGSRCRGAVGDDDGSAIISPCQIHCLPHGLRIL